MYGPRLTVVLVDDHPIILQGLAGMLAGSAFETVGTATTLKQGVDLIRERRPDIAIVDLRIGMDLAPDLLRQLRQDGADVPVVVLTAFDDGDLIRCCLDAGARAILLKDASSLDLVATLGRVLAGESIIDERLASRDHQSVESERYLDGGFERLSEREYQLLRLMAQGLNTREMAAAMSLRLNTVRSYTQTVLGKLQSRNRVMALATARRMRLI